MEHSCEHDVCFKWLIRMLRVWRTDECWEICSTVLTIFNKILDSTSQNVHYFTNFLVTAYIVPPSRLFYTDIRLQENYLFSLRRITQNGKFIIRGNPESIF